MKLPAQLTLRAEMKAHGFDDLQCTCVAFSPAETAQYTVEFKDGRRLKVHSNQIDHFGDWAHIAMTSKIEALNAAYLIAAKARDDAVDALKAAVLEASPYKVGVIVENMAGARAQIVMTYAPTGKTEAYFIALLFKADGTLGKREIKKGWSVGWSNGIKVVP